MIQLWSAPAATMLSYRCCLLASDGRVNSRREYVAKDDIEATELARAIYRIHVEGFTPGYGFEVWRGVRQVFRLVENVQLLAECPQNSIPPAVPLPLGALPPPPSQFRK